MASPKRLNFDVLLCRTFICLKNDQNIDVYFKCTRFVYCVTYPRLQTTPGDLFVYVLRCIIDVLRCIKTLQKTSQLKWRPKK